MVGGRSVGLGRPQVCMYGESRGGGQSDRRGSNCRGSHWKKPRLGSVMRGTVAVPCFSLLA